jgi:hypothetical protein
MSQLSADSPPLPPGPGADWLPGPKPPSEGWSRRKFLSVLAFVFAFHVALIVLFGTKKPIVPFAVTNVPHLELANNANELIALNDPTLFARPNAHDLVTAFWRHTKPLASPKFNWTEPPRYLPYEPEGVGAAVHELVQRGRSAALPLNLKPEPQSIVPPISFARTMPQATIMQISGQLAQRRLLNPIPWPSWPRNDVIAPSQVQALVDTGGFVWSVVLLPGKDTDKEADQLALQLVRKLHFAPGPGLTLGEITFAWHTVPTNDVPPHAP